MKNVKKILLGIYLAVLAVFCMQLGGTLLYAALGLALVSLLCVLNGFTEKEEPKETSKTDESDINIKQE